MLRPDLGTPVAAPIPEPDPALAARLKAVFIGMMTGNMDAASFVPALQRDLGPRMATGQEERRAFFADFGSFQSFDLISRKTQDERLALQYRASLEYMVTDVFVTLDAAGKISNWGVRGGG